MKKSQSKQESQVGKLDYSKNEVLLKYESLENTPFTLVDDKEKGFYIVMGQYLLTEPFKTKKEAMKFVEKPTWQSITQVALCLIDSNNKNNINLENLKADEN